MTSTRRQVLNVLAASTAATLLPRAVASALGSPGVPAAGLQGTAEIPRSHQGEHTSVALPFDAKKLRGLSERLILSHHENNYGGAVRNLNKVEVALAELPKDAAPHLVAGLRERELTFSNSVVLHELYFGNLGGDGKPDGEVVKALAASHGSLGRWEEEFRATCGALGGGSGWVTLDFDLRTSALRTHASGHHTQASAFAAPLLVMDMYEHAYHMDFGAAAAKYIAAFFENVDWAAVELRFQRARAAAKALQA